MAKKIIIASPVFSRLDRFFLFFGKRTREFDENVLLWALAQSDFFSENDWREIQLKKLKNILAHAWRNVPYWQKIFEKNDFNPHNFSSFDDLKKLPILSRQELKDIPIENLVAENIDRKRMVEQYTSGSTGEPLRFFQDVRDLFYRRVCTYEARRYLGFSSDARFCILGLEELKNLQGLGICISPKDLEFSKFRLHHMYPRLISHRPQILVGTPSYLERFLYFFQKDGFHLEINAIVYTGENLNADLGVCLENFFKAKVFSAYGTKEISPLGTSCHKKNLHIVPWSNYMEIVEGRIIATSLENMAMPLFRYDTGDTGVFHEKKCACGRIIRSFELRGRDLGSIERADGSHYHIGRICYHLGQYYSNKIKRFQIEQKDEPALIFRYIPTLGRGDINLETKLENYFTKIIGSQLSVRFESVENILPNKNGKTPIFIKYK